MNNTIEKVLEENGKHYQTTVGDSMEPMLRDRTNIVEIVKPSQPLKRYDLPLYRRPSGQYVLHRIHKVKKDCYITCGDNRYFRERVPKEWVVGVMSGYYKDGAYIPATDPKYRRYVKRVCNFFYIRAVKLFIKRKLKRIFKKK